MHRGEERDDVVLRVAARQTDVAEPEGGLERMDGRVETELVPAGPEGLDELA